MRLKQPPGGQGIRRVLPQRKRRTGEGSEVRAADQGRLQACADNFTKKRTGTAFGGVAEVGVTMSELLKRDPKE
jgi:hypothetical protein